MAEPSLSSPCVRKCTLDACDTCLGCGRTLREILDWHAMDAASRAEVLARAAARVALRASPRP